ncbi:hypothetical protein CY35_12G021600 [Sphagnum magellanicum]|nr:hypothetical protein CY35_12G021600 [Sphagnum magellanicum]
MKLLVMLLTFQHLLLLGVLSFSRSPEIGLSPDVNISRQCAGNMNQLVIQDMDALLSLYAAWSNTPNILTQLPQWTPNIPSNDSCYSPCYDRWYGVMCDSFRLYVIALELIDRNLQGPLDPAIGNLSQLEILTISNNPGLVGPLPSTIGQLQSLVLLDLHNNSLNGTIPVLSGLTSLNELLLNGNALTGQLADVFQNLGSNTINNVSTELLTLDLSSNRLTGVFNISTICESFLLIQQLNLSRNQLNGTLDFRQLSSTIGVSVPILDLSFNNFSGDLLTINNSKTNLASFEVLLLNNNQLTGDFPNLTLATDLTTLNLSTNKLSGSLPPSIWASPNIIVLDLSENNFSNNLPNLPVVKESIFICPESLTNLNLAGNSLNGSFPSELLNCSTKLQVINCDGNAFSGALNMNVNTSALSGELSMVNNDISELIPSWESGRYSPVLLGGNPICKAISNGGPNNEFIVYDNPSQNENFYPQLNCRYNSSQPFIIRDICSSHKAVWILSTTLPFSFAIICGFILWKYYMQTLDLRKTKKEIAKLEVQPILYTYTELRAITNNFHGDNELGKGSFGVVYKGTFPDGRHVAVKCMRNSPKGVAEFLNEVKAITGISHINLVKLEGYCVRGEKVILVYEYVENKDLHEALCKHAGETKNALISKWLTRFKICVGIARGLAYLHEEVTPRIIHRDIKLKNILLDKEWNPKIADFGTVQLFPDDITNLCMSRSMVAGTRGYMAPEINKTSCHRINEKVDVYSFGIVVLEIISGREREDFSQRFRPEEKHLCDWAFSLEKDNKLLDLVDKTLEKPTNLEQQQMQSVAKVTLLCVQPNPENRPSMSNVLEMLLAEKIPSVPQTGGTVIPIGIEIGSTTTISDPKRC